MIFIKIKVHIVIISVHLARLNGKIILSQITLKLYMLVPRTTQFAIEAEKISKLFC